MAKRKLLKEQDRRKLFDVPVDEDSLIRHYSLSPADRLEIELRRREHNRLGFAVQLCLMRHPGRVLGAERFRFAPCSDMLPTKSAPTQKRLHSMHAVKKPVAITRRASCFIWIREARRRKIGGPRYWLQFRRRRCLTTVLRSQVHRRHVSPTWVSSAGNRHDRTDRPCRPCDSPPTSGEDSD